MASYPQGLDQMFFGPIGGDFAVEQFNQARQADMNANKKSLQDLMFQQQEQPLKLDQLRAGNRNTNALAEKTELDNKFSHETWDPRVRAEISKYAAQIDDDKLKQVNAQLERDMMNPDPRVSGPAQKMFQFTKAMTQFREQENLKNKHKLGEIGETGRQQRLTQQQAIDAGKFANKGGSSVPGDFWTQFYKTRGAKNQHAMVLSQLERLKITEPNSPEIPMMENIARSLHAQAQAEIASAKPGAPNIEAIADLPVNPAPNIGGPQAGPRTQSGQVGPAQPNLAAAAEQAWGGYDPAKYDYRMVNGKLQRKPKGQ